MSIGVQSAFVDRVRAATILDRFLHNAEVTAITGRSYRLTNRAAKLQAA